MNKILALFTVASMLVFSLACSSSRMGYSDTRLQHSVVEAQTRNKGRRTLVGEEARRHSDSVLKALMKLTNLDSAAFFSIPEGHARVMNDDGTWYYRKLTEEELERNKQLFESKNQDYGPIIAYDLEGQRVGTAGYRERGKPYQINTDGLVSGTYMLAIPGEKRMIKIVVQ